MGAKGLKSSGDFRKLREGARSFRSMQDGGTYNPKSAWMMVDSRRRVLQHALYNLIIWRIFSILEDC